MRGVAREFNVSLSTVQRWLARAGDRSLSKVDWNGLPAGPRASTQRTKASMEERVLKVRKRLKTQSDLGEYGAVAIQRELESRGIRNVPSVRTIGRILERRGALDGRRRLRRQAPPPGWFLPQVMARQHELDSFDMVEDLVIRGGQDVNVLTGISLHGGLAAAWPEERITAKLTVKHLISHWQQFGLPAYAKFDNDTVFQGAHQYPDSFGRVTRLCLSLGVTPIFAPPLSRGFQADIEAFNRRWQEAVWARFQFRSRDQVRERSERFLKAHRDRYALRIEDAPERTAFPPGWSLDLQAPLKGTVIYLRSTTPTGMVSLLGHTYSASPLWCSRLVRAEVDLTAGRIHIHSLRRRTPHDQPLLATHPYEPPTKPFQE